MAIQWLQQKNLGFIIIKRTKNVKMMKKEKEEKEKKTKKKGKKGIELLVFQNFWKHSKHIGMLCALDVLGIVNSFGMVKHYHWSNKRELDSL